MAVFNYFGIYFTVIVVLVVLCHAQIDNLSGLSRSQKALGSIAGVQRRWPSTRRVNSKTYRNRYRGKRSIDESFFENTNSASERFRDGLRRKRQAQKMQMWDFHPSSMVRRRILQSRNHTIGDEPRIRTAQNSPHSYQHIADNTTIPPTPVVRGSRLQTDKQVMAVGNNINAEPTSKNVQISQEHFNAILKLGPDHLVHGVVRSNASTKRTHTEQPRTKMPSVTPRRSISTRVNQRQQVQQRPRSGISTSQAQLRANQNVGLNRIHPHNSTYPAQQYNTLKSQLQVDGAVLDKFEQLMASPNLNNSSSSQNNKERLNVRRGRPTLKQSTTGSSEPKSNEINRIIAEAKKIMQTINSTLLQTRPRRTNQFSPSSNNKSGFKPTQRSMTSNFKKPSGKARNPRKPMPTISNQMSTQQNRNAKQGAPTSKIPVKRNDKLNSLPPRTLINQQLKVQRQHIQSTRHTEPQLKAIPSKRPVTDLQQSSKVLTPLPTVNELRSLIKQRKQQPNKQAQKSNSFRGSDKVKNVSKPELRYPPKVFSSVAPKTPNKIATIPTVDIIHQRQTSLQQNLKHRTNQSRKDKWPQQSKITQINMGIQNQETWPQNQPTNKKPYQPSPGVIDSRPQNLQTQPISLQLNPGKGDNWQQQTQQNTYQLNPGMANAWPQQQQQQQIKQNRNNPNATMFNNKHKKEQTHPNDHQPKPGTINILSQQQQTKQNTYKPNPDMTNSWSQQQQTKHSNPVKTSAWPQEDQVKKDTQHSNPRMTGTRPETHQTKQTKHHSNRVMTNKWSQQHGTKQKSHTSKPGMSNNRPQGQQIKQNIRQPNQGLTNTWPQEQQTGHNANQLKQDMTNAPPKEQQTKRNIRRPNQGMTNTWLQEQQTNNNTQQLNQGMSNTLPQEQQRKQNIRRPNQGMSNNWPQEQQTNHNTHQPKQGMANPWPQEQQRKQNTRPSNQGMTNSWPQEQQTNHNTHQPKQGMTNTWPQEQQTSHNNSPPNQGMTNTWPQEQQTKQNTRPSNKGMTNTWPQEQQTNHNTRLPKQGMTNSWPQEQQTSHNNSPPNQGMTNTWPQEQQTSQNTRPPDQGMTNTWPQEQQTSHNTRPPNQGMTNTWPQEQQTSQNTRPPNQGVTNTWPQEQQTSHNTRPPNQGMTNTWPQEQQTSQNTRPPNQGMTNTWPQEQQTSHNTRPPNQGMTNTWPQEQQTSHNTRLPKQGMTNSWPQGQQTKQNTRRSKQGMINNWPKEQQTSHNNRPPTQGMINNWPKEQQTSHNNSPPNQGMINNWPKEQQTSHNNRPPNQGMTNSWPQEQQTKQNTRPLNRDMTNTWPQEQQTSYNTHQPNQGVTNTWPQEQQSYNIHQPNQGMTKTRPQQQQTRKFMHHPNTEMTKTRPQQQLSGSNKHQLKPAITTARFQQWQTHTDYSKPTNPNVINAWTPENPPREMKTHQASGIIRNRQDQQVDILSLQPSERHNIQSGYTSTVRPHQTGRLTTSRYFMANDKIMRSTQKRPMSQPNNNYQQEQRSPLPLYIDRPSSATVPTTAPRRFSMESSTPVSKRPSPNGIHVSHKLFAYQTRSRNEYPKQNVSNQVNRRSNRPKLIPSTIFPLPNRQKELQVLQTVRPNFVQHQNNDVAVKNPLAPVNLWQPATAVPGDHSAQKDWTAQSPNHQPQETYQPTTTANKTVNGGRYVKNWFLPRNFKQTSESRQTVNIQPSIGTKQLTGSSQITGNNRSVWNDTRPLSPPVIVRSNNGRRNSKPLRVTVSNRVGERTTGKKQRRGNKKDQAPQRQFRGSGKRNATLRRHHHTNQKPSSINPTTTRPTPVVTDKDVFAKNNSPGFADHVRHILNQIRKEHASTHANIDHSHQTTTAARTTPISHQYQATSAPNVASIQHNHGHVPSPEMGALPKYKLEHNLDARVNNQATNVNSVNMSTNTKSDNNRTISISQSKVSQGANQGISQIHPGVHHPPINFNVYLELPSVPMPTHQQTQPQSQTDALRLLEALKVLQGNIGHLSPPVTQNPPVNIILQVEPDKKPGKLSCRCFNKSDGCPYELKEEPLMDMCDVKTEVPCCDDN